MNQDSVIITCGRCGAKNRVPRDRRNDTAKCGKCHQLLPQFQNGKPVLVTDTTFQEEILGFPGVALVDCWAAWCGPCQTVGPVIDAVSRSFSGQAKIAKLNVDENPVIASRYRVQSIPTLLFFKNGKLVHQLVGALPQQQIEQQLRALL